VSKPQVPQTETSNSAGSSGDHDVDTDNPLAETSRRVYANDSERKPRKTRKEHLQDYLEQVNELSSDDKIEFAEYIRNYKSGGPPVTVITLLKQNKKDWPKWVDSDKQKSSELFLKYFYGLLQKDTVRYDNGKRVLENFKKSKSKE
jgi:hypothetical protein